MAGRGNLNVESELEPVRNESEERFEVDDFVADGMEDEANVSEYNDDDPEQARETLDDLDEDTSVL